MKKNAKTLFEQAHDHLLARRDHLPKHRSRHYGTPAGAKGARSPFDLRTCSGYEATAD
ncbi:MAG: hypothetical protein WKG07_26095 [Hymenobacter sp.]